ncbi:T9SS type A sorting domain-containing protein [Flavobacterium sp. CYK-4]|uniref:T9SS-dependent choice-of-anchor J family protein n=1 Tax=Flavobacterium lotistagni TaxID=2709660 RepID=UPI00140AD1F5|nr:T9SS type A sorting domain-containing protein [Flavobacterium lotistagni]NHM07319.1 T9SS type A sorting domain-containing protein [Flavobacterium lotistagni]
MNKLLRRFVYLMIFYFQVSPALAQTTIFDQTLLTQSSFSAFTPVSVTGAQTWYFSSTYGAVCNGYAAGQSVENEDWLISSPINLSATNNVKLTFSHTRGNAAVVNVGVLQGWYKVFATANYTGNPTTTTWVELQGLNQTLPAAWQYVSSGELIVPESAKSENSRIAFRYISSASQSATWEIKNVRIVGEPLGNNPNAGLFRITNWNTEWLGCSTFGPTDETLQLSNIASAMLSMNSDIYCIQEVSNTNAVPTIANLVSLLGNDQWEGKIVPTLTNDCDQRQGIIYKKARVQFVSASQLSNGNASQGNSYSYNWTNGRFPALYNVNLISGNASVPLSLINIHAKAEDGTAMSYTRRLGGSIGLKGILDGASYNTKNLIILGDFNDYLLGTTSTTCNCSVSPYKNFMDDEADYKGITSSIIDVDTNFGIHPIIENIIISNELFANYFSVAAQEVTLPFGISNYYNTTSNHLPVSVGFQFSALSDADFSVSQQKPWSVYPNPVQDQLKFDRIDQATDATIEVYDLTGRTMRFVKVDENTLNVADLPSGIYILKVATRLAKFVKE